MRNIHDYSSIMNQPYHKSTRHPHMSNYDRAAQFAPFAALTGHKEMVSEKERLVDSKRVLSDDQKMIINQILSTLQKGDTIRITYFQKDLKKDGGKYILDEVIIKKIDEYYKQIILTDGTKINIDDIYHLERI